MDPRATRSRQRLRVALLQLLYEKDLDDIQIHELTERADTAISTFYRHYANKLDLLKDTLDHLKEMAVIQRDALSLTLPDILDLNQPPPTLFLLRVIEQNKTVFRRLLKTPYSYLVFEYFTVIGVDQIQQDTPQWSRQEAELIMGSIVGSVFQWVLLDLPYDVDQFAKRLHWTLICGLMALRGEFDRVTLPTEGSLQMLFDSEAGRPTNPSP